MDKSNALVFLKGNTPFTNSLVIAKGTNNEHRAILQLVKKYEEKFNRWDAVRFSHLKCGNNERDLRGRPTKVAFLNEQQATFLITLLKNTDVVLDFKAELVDRFYKMREIIARHQNAEWIDARHDVKSYQKFLNDMLKDLVDYAVNQGCKHADKLYINYNRLINKTLGIDPASRDQQPAYVLHEIRKLQAMIETTVRGLMHKHVPYKQIYQDCKSTLTSYSQLAFIGQQRFIA